MLQHTCRFSGALGSGLLQPEPGFGRLMMLWSAIQLTEFQLCLTVASTGSLAQHLEADTAITLAVAFLAEQPTKSALSLDNAFKRRLFEQLAGDPLDASGLSQVLVVQQP